MAKNSVDAYKAEGKTNLLSFDPKKLKLVTDKSHPLYDPRVENPAKPEVVASIKLKGVALSILVWKDPETGDVIVVDGRGRTKACLLANEELAKEGKPLREIPGSVVKGGIDNAVALMAMANEGRTDPTTKGRMVMARALIAANYSEEQSAIILHCSPATFRNYVALSGATAAVQSAVETEKVSLSDGYKLSKLEPAAQREKLAEVLEKAPREAGAKRSKNGKKAKAIVSGASQMMGKRAILKEIERVAERSGERANGYVQALRMVLGEKGADPL